jgi:hypothetical protein
MLSHAGVVRKTAGASPAKSDVVFVMEAGDDRGPEHTSGLGGRLPMLDRKNREFGLSKACTLRTERMQASCATYIPAVNQHGLQFVSEALATGCDILILASIDVLLTRMFQARIRYRAILYAEPDLN